MSEMLKPYLILDMVGLLLPDPAVPGVRPAVALAVCRFRVRRHRRRGVVGGWILQRYDL